MQINYNPPIFQSCLEGREFIYNKFKGDSSKVIELANHIFKQCKMSVGGHTSASVWTVYKEKIFEKINDFALTLFNKDNAVKVQHYLNYLFIKDNIGLEDEDFSKAIEDPKNFINNNSEAPVLSSSLEYFVESLRDHKFVSLDERNKKLVELKKLEKEKEPILEQLFDKEIKNLIGELLNLLPDNSENIRKLKMDLIAIKGRKNTIIPDLTSKYLFGVFGVIHQDIDYGNAEINQKVGIIKDKLKVVCPLSQKLCDIQYQLQHLDIELPLTTNLSQKIQTPKQSSSIVEPQPKKVDPSSSNSNNQISKSDVENKSKESVFRKMINRIKSFFSWLCNCFNKKPAKRKVYQD